MPQLPYPRAEANSKKSSARRPLHFRLIDLGVVEGNHNMIQAINNAGRVVGSALAAGGGIQAFVADGQKRTLGSLGGAFSAAHGINSAGKIVGGSLTDGNERFHAFLYTGGAMYDLNGLVVDAEAWELVQAVGINDRNQIIGVGLVNGEDHVFLLHPDHSTRRRRTSSRKPRVI